MDAISGLQTARITDKTPPFTAGDSQFASLLQVLTCANELGRALKDDADDVRALIMASRWLCLVRTNPDVIVEAPTPSIVDLDTEQHGTDAPFEPWDHDATSLVHVLWHLKHAGQRLGTDNEEIGATIVSSRWLAAQRADAKRIAAGIPPARKPTFW